MVEQARKITRALALSLAVALTLVTAASAGAAGGKPARISLYPAQSAGKVNPLVFGTNMIGYDPSTSEGWGADYVGYSNFGSGIWNPATMSPVPEVVGLAREAGVSVMRFPGGDGSWFYNWKNSIGPAEKRKKFLYGLDEFLRSCEAVGAQAVFTLPYYIMSERDAADLVSYLNGKPDPQHKGGTDWAAERVKNGHAAPYHVKYFELGNEVFYGIARKSVPPVDPVKYGRDYLAYQAAMRAVDPSIKLGAVTYNSGTSKGMSAWNETLFRTAGARIDFLIEHTYRPGYQFNDEKVNAEQLYSHTLNSLGEVEAYYRNLSRQFAVLTGRKEIPLAITEYNGGFVQDKPVPFRHALGTALFNAGLLQIFMKPENNILMANYWQFVNSYYGMIKNAKFMEGKGGYLKRPNYYAQEMFKKHFGSQLVQVKVSEPQLSPPAAENLLAKVKWHSSPVSGATATVSGDDVAVSFDQNKDVNFFHVSKNVPVKPATTYLLSGYIKAQDLRTVQGICLSLQDARGWNSTRSAVSTARVWGNTDWVYVSSEFVPLSDAREVSVQIRRVSGNGPVQGKALIRDVRLSEVREEDRAAAGRLSVSASRSGDGKSVYLMVLNKSVKDEVPAQIDPPQGSAGRSIEVWTLNGSSVSATNETAADSVTISHRTLAASAKQLSFNFPAHSLTSLEFRVK